MDFRFNAYLNKMHDFQNLAVIYLLILEVMEDVILFLCASSEAEWHKFLLQAGVFPTHTE